MWLSVRPSVGIHGFNKYFYMAKCRYIRRKIDVCQIAYASVRKYIMIQCSRGRRMNPVQWRRQM